MSNDGLLNSTEVAELLRVHPKHLYRLLRQGLPGHRVGRGHWRFDREEVLAWVREGRSSSKASDDAKSEPPSRPIELALCTGERSQRRFVVGRVGERWIGHPIATDDRCADALFVQSGRDDHVFAAPCAALERLADNVLLAGCASMLGVILDRLGQDRPGRGHWIAANSTTALRWLAAGQVHVAGIHLADPMAGLDHATIVREAIDRPCQLVHLFRWRLGLIVRDEALGIADVEDLARPELRLALRERGSGAMQVLARALEQAGVDATELDDRPSLILSEHRAVAQAIALGAADVGLAVEPVARERQLGFIPLVEESFELVVPDELLAHASVRALIEQLDRPLIRREIATLGPYDTSSTGHATSVSAL